MNSPQRLVLFNVVLRCSDGSMAGADIIERGLTKEAAELAAAKVNDMEGPFVASVRRTNWKLVAVA